MSTLSPDSAPRRIFHELLLVILLFVVACIGWATWIGMPLSDLVHFLVQAVYVPSYNICHVAIINGVSIQYYWMFFALIAAALIVILRLAQGSTVLRNLAPGFLVSFTAMFLILCFLQMCGQLTKLSTLSAMAAQTPDEIRDSAFPELSAISRYCQQQFPHCRYYTIQIATNVGLADLTNVVRLKYLMAPKLAVSLTQRPDFIIFLYDPARPTEELQAFKIVKQFPIGAVVVPKETP